MSRTVTALYDSRAEAEAARDRLASEVNLKDVDIVAQDGGAGSGDTDAGGGGLGELYLTDEDRHAYGEGIRRGGYLLTAHVKTGEDPDRIIRLLEESPTVDLDERQEAWRSEGWQPYSGAGMGTSGAAGNAVEEQRIPVVEEQLRVGKREVARGGARVRSYVREVPVREEVELREEHVSIGRRPVEERLSEADLAESEILQERVIEVSQIREEAVINKEAVVREELVVNKTVERRTEEVEGTVRRTEVEVEDLPGSETENRSAFGGFDGGGSDRNG
jgi:uncharacterized protein (TIGR02271 family)